MKTNEENNKTSVEGTYASIAAELVRLGDQVDPLERIKLEMEIAKLRSESNKVEVGVIVADSNQLKNEQNNRIGYRDRLVYTAFAVAAGAVYAISQGASPLVLLGLVPAVLSLGWIYQANDTKVSEIREYVRSELAPRTQELLPEGANPFGWESWHRDRPGRWITRTGHLAVTLAIFCVLPATALVMLAKLSTLPSWAHLVGGVEAVATLCIGWLFIRANLLRRRARKTVVTDTDGDA
ncbi:hypothetical protein [Actinomadura sp. KC345]|uniref:hypothetical protein n=1 Tax=Actinomadura sp. KC345 TaxID=2530371 RepID=UPI0014043E99|nr:hypothetical protein [Actinomadura sp. KC345]